MDSPKPKDYSPQKLFALIVASIFVVEFGIMVALQYLFGPKPPLENFLDSTTLVVIIYPVLYFYIYRPMVGEIARRKSAEAELQAHSNELEKFKMAVNSVSEHIVITDSDGKVIFANPAAEKITGYSQKEILGKKAGNRELWGGRMDSEFYKELWYTIKIQKQSFSGEILNRRKNGTDYNAYSTITPVLNRRGDVEFFVSIERDITREKAIDRAKTEFVSLASHQLRTPTTAINWFSKMLLNGEVGKINADQKHYLKNIYDGNKRMMELISALLDVSRIELGTFSIMPEVVSLPEICNNLISELKSQLAAKKIRLTADYQPFLPKISADPRLAYIIFQNLLTNAVNYSPPKSRISVAISVNKDQEPGYYLISVKDQGIGIPAQEQDKIFSKLYRADNAREEVPEGTGLGLYIVKSVLEHTGGEIWFESEENKGSTFFVKLPLTGMKQKEGEKALL